ncbi:MAG TPA: transglutaminase domain-containing protein [Candidatus Pacearchaeota archaeon]|nr:transglutaminase domain-containing protein [Candidatus Pacearchaeota archaeon]
MESISDQVNRHPTKKVFIGYGDTAIFNTLNIMKDIIKKSASNYYVRRWAEKLTENYKNKIDKVKSIFDFIGRNTSYLSDPHKLELLKTPLVSLKELENGERPQLDCDDFTILSLSLLKSIGFPVAIKAISTNNKKRFTHVYGLVFVNKKWIPVDLTRPDYGFKWEYNKPTRITELEI